MLDTPIATAPYDLQAVRDEFPITRECVYLNHAGISPLSSRVRNAMTALLDDGVAVADPAERHKTLLDDTRAAIARLVGGKPSEIALVQNTSEGINLAAHALSLEPGDNVILCDMEFPSTVYPWLNLERIRGIEARIIPHHRGGLAVADLERAADSRTRVVVASVVEFLTGFRNDVSAIGAWCRARGATFVADGIQSLGHLPLDVRQAQIDVLASGTLKSLMGPPGQGLLYVRQELIPQLQPPFAGPLSVVDWANWRDYNLTFLPDARRFELGTYNWVGLAGMKAAVEFLMELGLSNIERWTLHLTDILIADLQRRGYAIASCLDPACRSSIVSFSVANPQAALEKLKAARVIVARREDYIRVSTHCYNTEAEILKVGQVLGNA